MHAQWTSCQFSEIFCLDSFPCFHRSIQLGWEVFLNIKLEKRLFIFHLSSQRGSSLCDHHHHEHQRQNWRSKLQSRFWSPTASPSFSSIKLAMIGKRLKVRDQLELPFEILPDLLTSSLLHPSKTKSGICQIMTSREVFASEVEAEVDEQKAFSQNHDNNQFYIWKTESSFVQFLANFATGSQLGC